ncbi:MAG: hypothetical protein RL721_2030, partial [Candidatus Eisenbacteria bacterium]
TDLGFEATVVSPPDAEGRVQLRRGSFTIQSHVARLAAVESAPGPRTRQPVARYEASDEPPPLEADLRGMDVSDALAAVDRAVIHGIGTGVLRKAVQQHLKGHPQVESQRWGEGHEGGRGVTVARLR